MNTMQYEAGFRACVCDLRPRDGGCGVSVGVGGRGLGAGRLVGANWGRRSIAGWLGLDLVFFWGGARWGGWVAIFWGFFASIGEIFILLLALAKSICLLFQLMYVNSI